MNIFRILCGNLESLHLLHNLIGGHEMVVVTSLETLQVHGLKWHVSERVLHLDPLVINMASSKVLEGGGNGLEPLVHLLMVFTILHEESLRLIGKGLISCSSHAFIANKHIEEAFPSFLGGGEMLDMRQVLGPNGNLDHVKSGCIELAINHFSSCQVVGVHGLESFFNNSPKLDARASHMRDHLISPLTKV
jgi:hypothetical protein